MEGDEKNKGQKRVEISWKEGERKLKIKKNIKKEIIMGIKWKQLF